jgi:hypothetical protein
VVVLPSITENAQALARTKGISFYEHRQLYHIALLRDPTIKRVIFLSSIPVGAHPFSRHRHKHLFSPPPPPPHRPRGQ